MNQSMNQLGVNLAYYSSLHIKDQSIKRLEVCLGRTKSYEDYYSEIMLAIQEANKRQIPVSVHLPMIIREDFEGDYLDAFYLDPDPLKRQASFQMLETNLAWASDFELDYVVIHFSGRYERPCDPSHFKSRLIESLDRINQLAKTYHTRILLEYFGVNINFYQVTDWISAIDSYEHLGLLIDIGHFHFASVLRSFDFMEGLKTLLPHAQAFHFWTGFGGGAYDTCQAYQKHHHIVPNLSQTKEEGWFFNTQEVLDLLITSHKPIIIEASNHFKDASYYEQSIKGLETYINLNSHLK